MVDGVLIGSRALSHWTGIPVQDGTDWDVISDEPIPGTEWHDPTFLNNRTMMEDYQSYHTILFGEREFVVMHPVGLAIIKRSHLWRSLGFQKHITHYHRHLSKYIKNFSEEDVWNLEERIDLTKKAFPQVTPKLNVMKEEFFDDFVTKVYDHDWLHELFAHYEEPLYKRLTTREGSVWCDMKKFDSFCHDDKLKCVAEEAYVIATERFLVPNDWKYPSKKAFYEAVQKICTTLCSGKFRDFAIDFYPEVLVQYRASKFEEVKNHIESLPQTDRRYFK